MLVFSPLLLLFPSGTLLSDPLLDASVLVDVWVCFRPVRLAPRISPSWCASPKYMIAKYSSRATQGVDFDCWS